MKKRRTAISIVLLCMVAVAVLASVFIFGQNPEYVSEVDKNRVEAAYNLLKDSLRTETMSYTDFLSEASDEYGQETVSAEPVNGTKITAYDGLVAVLDYSAGADYVVNVKEAGFYHIALDYKPMGNTLADFNIEVKINGTRDYEEMKNIMLPLYWTDETKEYPKDRYGDEMAPNQISKSDWTSLPLYNNTYISVEPLLFKLQAGENIISVTNISGNGLGIGTLSVLAPDFTIPDYSEYRSLREGELIAGLLKVNSTSYTLKNTTQAIYSSENNTALTPHDSEYKKLNTLTWTEAGSEIAYELNAPEDGYYHIAFHYRNGKEEFDVFNTIRIDGEAPFKELQSYAFPSTQNNWGNETLSDDQGEPYDIYLTKGIHSLTMKAEQEPIVQAWHYAKLICEHVSQLELEITKITGSAQDKNRTWQMTRYLPLIPDYLAAYGTLIDAIKYDLQDDTPNGVKSALLSDLDKAMQFIDEMAEYPDEIALYKTNLTSGRDNSVLKSVSNFATELVTQDFALDMIYLYGEEDLPKPRASIVASLSNSFKTLINTFISDKYHTENDPEVLNIWVNRATTHVDLLQKMADTDFTPKSGIKVKISIMPDANKLTLGVAAGEIPDVALGLGSHIPFELASRGALYDLTKFEDFWNIQDRFVPGSSVPYIYNEGIYAMPETLDFNALIYRTDIFDSIGLTVPDTWKEVTTILPTLQRYGMNFYHNISFGVGYKWYHQTAPLIFQNNGKLFTEDGLRTAIDQPDSVKGIQALGDLFIAYSLQKEVISFFNSFRYSTLPIGIVGLNDYILIKNGAQELDGKWALSAYPGTEQSDGSISRWYIANGTGGVIFEDSEKISDSWTFLKWWTDYETQIDYTYTLRSTYGKTFVWLSSNVNAVADSPFDQEDKQVIMEQIKWLRDVPRSPGQYMLERSISDIWNSMINDGVSAQVAIDEKVIDINREIKKKMKELGYYDDQGNLLKSYKIRDVDWIILQTEKAKQEVE
ncbi:MAG: ABC-type transport system, substrate-binding component [Herbinix sp.]|jgi:ABC-type glycerol-3-phosphate transport system substrate-binding protein|nr:ABC-type transport system, substrate-binding component [Herbinix sp.]